MICHSQNMKSDSPSKGQQHKSILKSDAVSPCSGEAGKRVHFMVNDETGAATEATEGVLEAEDSTGDVTEKNMEQLMVASDATAVPAPDDKDSSTITIFNENSEVCCSISIFNLS